MLAMAHHQMHLCPEYPVPNLTDFGPETYYQEGTSTASSPSPIMYIHQVEQMKFENFQELDRSYAYYDPSQTVPIVEFTDLTAPYQEDRRRRRSQAKDKQTISSMHMRRRAQNRASQRAFRERKEKHAQDLQQQLDELEGKHKQLQASYEQLGSTNEKLVNELEGLRARISTVQASHDVESSLGSDESERFKVDFELEEGIDLTI